MGADVASGERWQAWTPLGVHALAVQAIGFSVRPAISYAALDAGVAPALLGLLSASYAIAPLLLALPVGRLVDRVGEKPVLIGGAVVAALSCGVLLAGTHQPAWLIVGLMLAGVGHLLCVIGEQTAVANMGGSSADSRFAAYTFASSLGQAVGPLLLTVGDGTAAGIRPVLLAALGLSVVLFGTSFLIGGRRQSAGEQAPVSVGSLLRDRSLRRAVVVSGIVMAAVDITLVYLPALGHEAGFSPAFVGWVLALRAVTSMAVRLVTGPLVNALGRRRMLIIGMSASASALIAVANWHSHLVLLVSAVVLGAGLGVCQPITMAAVSDLAPSNQRGTAMTLRLLGNRIGVVVLPGSIGLVAASAGASGVLGATAALLVVGCAVWMQR
ncbi:MFS transporter [Mycobacterium sp. 236(2023)]|uniref:MFS transporter n=1 Tax=Mycobacterium sp. 236(2023) TaxID=3038163 RepID=UPI0024153D8D|nr:MFS transporter [Mycobacterium sp. 236(2023)]MDG4668155.1 MFS transporter [Mycobacterium sp. 236(2023)]